MYEEIFKMFFIIMLYIYNKVRWQLVHLLLFLCVAYANALQ